MPVPLSAKAVKLKDTVLTLVQYRGTSTLQTATVSQSHCKSCRNQFLTAQEGYLDLDSEALSALHDLTIFTYVTQTSLGDIEQSCCLWGWDLGCQHRAYADGSPGVDGRGSMQMSALKAMRQLSVVSAFGMPVLAVIDA